MLVKAHLNPDILRNLRAIIGECTIQAKNFPTVVIPILELIKNLETEKWCVAEEITPLVEPSLGPGEQEVT